MPQTSLTTAKANFVVSYPIPQERDKPAKQLLHDLPGPRRTFTTCRRNHILLFLLGRGGSRVARVHAVERPTLEPGKTGNDTAREVCNPSVKAIHFVAIKLRSFGNTLVEFFNPSLKLHKGVVVLKVGVFPSYLEKLRECVTDCRVSRSPLLRRYRPLIESTRRRHRVQNAFFARHVAPAGLDQPRQFVLSLLEQEFDV
jgi:hypothetical protein